MSGFMGLTIAGRIGSRLSTSEGGGEGLRILCSATQSFIFFMIAAHSASSALGSEADIDSPKPLNGF